MINERRNGTEGHGGEERGERGSESGGERGERDGELESERVGRRDVRREQESARKRERGELESMIEMDHSIVTHFSFLLPTLSFLPFFPALALSLSLSSLFSLLSPLPPLLSHSLSLSLCPSSRLIPN